MYSFLRDGEFVQVTVEDQGHVTGFVSRYGDSESDRGVFLDHFFKSGKLDGNQLAFTTETVHGVSFEFRGTIERGEGKKPGRRGVLRSEGNSGREHHRRSEEDLFPLARGYAEKFPAGFGAATSGKEIGASRTIRNGFHHFRTIVQKERL